MLSSENRILIVKSEHIAKVSNTAETKDRTILSVVFAGISCSVPRPSMRLSVTAFQLSPKIDDDCGSASKVFTFLLICRPLGSVASHLRHFFSISLNLLC